MRRRKSTKKISVGKLIFLFLITTIIVTILTLSKYYSTTAGKSDAKVAFPLIELNSEQVLETDINPTSEEKEFIFAVANNRDEQRTQVTMKYTIQIKTLNNLPLEFELYTYENNIRGEQNLLQGKGNTTDYILLDDVESDEENPYILIIKWEEGQKDYRYNNTIDYVQVVVNGVQID